MTAASFVFLGGAELPWIYALAAALARTNPTRAIRLAATRGFTPRPWWPLDDAPAGLERVAWNYPPGFNSRLSFLFTTAIRRRVCGASRSLEARGGTPPYVIVSDPRFARYAEAVTFDRLVYLNYDDYGAYGRDIAGAERTLVDRARVVLCSSAYQRERFVERYPNRAGAVFHLPHGVHEIFFGGAPAPSAPSVGIVGALTQRYDWALIGEVVRRLPHVEFVFAGEVSPGGAGQEEWRERMRAVLAERNVRHRTGVRYRHTPAVYQQASVSWMPYAAESAFVQAACPLKLGDGLASGRPVVSADVPECRLYPEWVSIHRSADDAVCRIERAIEASRDQTRTAAQIAFARQHTWQQRAIRLIDILAGARPA